MSPHLPDVNPHQSFELHHTPTQQEAYQSAQERVVFDGYDQAPIHKPANSGYAPNAFQNSMHQQSVPLSYNSQHSNSLQMGGMMRDLPGQYAYSMDQQNSFGQGFQPPHRHAFHYQHPQGQFDPTFSGHLIGHRNPQNSRQGFPESYQHYNTQVGGKRPPDRPRQGKELAEARLPAGRGTAPSYSRRPPRKPKQSGHALWVGNLPSDTQIIDLKDHFSKDARHDIESVFLISGSNCAFVNYRTEQSCAAAVQRFHESRFHGMRLVCRLRKTPEVSATQNERSHVATAGISCNEGVEGVSGPSEERGRQDSGDPQADPASIPEELVDTLNCVSDRYFIVKSLTLEDLEASVRDGVWATQAHNEDKFNKAFKSSDNVYLVFSVNKSGEYFGYAKMVSGITEDSSSSSSINNNNIDTTSRKMDATEAEATLDGPTSRITPVTRDAPQGRIVDDSARGIIFWEADHTVDSGESTPASGEKSGSSSAADSEWGKPFRIEWLSTQRVPFHRTRGLRNPWNSNREVKIARDGVELEPNVGRKLLQMFHGPAAMPLYQQQTPFYYHQPALQMPPVAPPFVSAQQSQSLSLMGAQQPLYQHVQGQQLYQSTPTQPVIVKSPQATRARPAYNSTPPHDVSSNQ